MAESCRERLFRLEVEVLQPVDRFVRQLKDICERQECLLYMLCLNVLVCWTSWFIVKIVEWVLILVIRWAYQIVCIAASLIAGLVLLVFLGPEILIRAFIDLIIFIVDVIHFLIGLVLYLGNNIIDHILTSIGVQDEKRRLTKEEIEVLRPIFGDSIYYSQIRINEGRRLGIMGPPFANENNATTIGYNIYARGDNNTINSVTLVHECAHVWQFQFAGTHYISQSVFTQLLDAAGITASPYYWELSIGTAPNSWFLLANVEAQAEFIEDLFNYGQFNVDEQNNQEDGAFFTIDENGQNLFTFSRVYEGEDEGKGSNEGTDYTVIANEAWRIINTG